MTPGPDDGWDGIRLQAIAFPLVPGMEKVQVVPAPKDIDPRVLTWKGAAVLAKLEAVNDMWITPRDWVRLPAHTLGICLS